MDLILKSNLELVAYNTMPGGVIKFFDGWIWKFSRFLNIIRILCLIFTKLFHPPKVIYISISGGVGIFFDSILAFGVWFLHCPVVVHHHSFSYVNDDSYLFRIFCRILKSRDLTHVVLCEQMGVGLCKRYPNFVFGSQIMVVSNSAFTSFDDSLVFNRTVNDVLTIGYISNITIEKGVLDVIKLYENCKSLGLIVKILVAGPCLDNSIRSKLESLSSNFDDFTYLGPVYGSDKIEFYKSIDILVFPTRYSNEAEPLVIYEAAQHGVPTIANARGCISTMVGRCGGWCVVDEEMFVVEALKVVSNLQTVDSLLSSREQAFLGVSYLHKSSQASLQLLLEKLTFVHDAKIR
jgi:glycosyltransferase involved in cell wall biosynthesis